MNISARTLGLSVIAAGVLGGSALGLAGVAGLAATGAVIARAERQRTAYTPDQVRERLRERHARATADVSE